MSKDVAAEIVGTVVIWLRPCWHWPGPWR